MNDSIQYLIIIIVIIIDSIYHSMQDVNYGFPYTPYPQQLQLMKAIHDCIENRNIGCFESPTGTGKSLSIVCASLSWLLSHERELIEKYNKTIANESSQASSSGDWLEAYIKQAEAQTTNNKLNKNDVSKSLDQYKMTIDQIERAKRNISTTTTAAFNPYILFAGQAKKTFDSNKHENAEVATGTDDTEESEFKLASFDDDLTTKSKETDKILNELTKEYNSKTKTADSSHTNITNADENEQESVADTQASAISLWESLEIPQIYYCTRTHSQIQQFVAELKKPTFASNVRCVVLASRKNLCINENVTGKQSVNGGGKTRPVSETTINERCLDMQKTTSTTTLTAKELITQLAKKQKVEGGKRVKKTSHCPYHNSSAEERLGYKLLSTLTDVEDLVIQGQRVHTCPYYTTKAAIPYAHIVCMPYNTLLDHHIRSHYSFPLQNRIVIIDEAHNLIDSIHSIYSIDYPYEKGITWVRKVLEAYKAYYETSLDSKHMYYINLLVRICKQLDALFRTTTQVSGICTAIGNEEMQSEIMTMNNFLFLTQLDSINLFTLLKYIDFVEFPRKLMGWLETFLTRYSQLVAFTNIASSDGKKVVSIADIQQALTNTNVWNTHIKNNTTRFVTQWMKQSATTRTNSTSSSYSKSGSSQKIPDIEDTSSLKQQLRTFFQFLRTLTHQEHDGRICVTRRCSNPSSKGGSIGSSAQSGSGYALGLKFILLNPTMQFHEILQQCRSVIMLGGTMQPFQYFETTLFQTPSTPSLAISAVQISQTQLQQRLVEIRSISERLQFFSCSHIVPANHVQGIILTHYAPTMNLKTLDGTHQYRYSLPYTNEIYLNLYTLARSVPNGMVVFFTSYAYMYAVLSRWKSSHGPINSHGSNGGSNVRNSSWYAQLEDIKCLFVEPKTSNTGYSISGISGVGETVDTINLSMSGEMEVVWEGYRKKAVEVGGKGAILFSVIGGKLSEGINFSDELARAVVIVGMPYPDSRDPILQERIRYYSSSSSSSTSFTADTAVVGCSTYSLTESMCMKAVNQAIGRCIRHAKDYAMVYLLDYRYAQSRILQQLPQWIRSQTIAYPHITPELLQQIQRFYSLHNTHSSLL